MLAVMRRIGRTARRLNTQSASVRSAALQDMPGLRSAFAVGRDGKLRRRLWHLPEICLASHHQNMAVFDRSVLYIGGLDLDARRSDAQGHPQRAAPGWHDVQLMLRGPVVAEAQRHLGSFLENCAGPSEPAPARRFIRTLTRRRRFNLARFGPSPLVTEICSSHEMEARKARNFIYLETQFFRDVDLAAMLARQAAEKPNLNLIVILPAAPDKPAAAAASGLEARYGAFTQARCIRIVTRAFGPRCFIGSGGQAPSPCPGAADGPVPPGTPAGSPGLCIQSKVSLFDGKSAILSSANLNERRLLWDTEAGVILRDAAFVDALCRRVMGHWLQGAEGTEFFSGPAIAEAWRARAMLNLSRPPEARSGYLLPYGMTAAGAFAI
ncbi:MAG: phospholipase [Tabrizicola sp.]|nr:phospholipase [Tabrizicola sp.]